MFDDKRADEAIAADEANAPVDLADIMRDEQFINALLGDAEVRTESDEDFELATLFSAARYSVLDAPADFELTDDQISAALTGGRRAAPPRSRMLTSLAAGAASVALVLGGLAVVSSNMGDAPGAGGSESRQIVSASMIRADLDEAQELLNQGEVVRGVELLNSTTDRMDQLVRTAEFDELNRIRVVLWSRATGQPESAAPAVGSMPTVPRDLPTKVPGGPAAVPSQVLPQVVAPPLPSLPLPSLPEVPVPGVPGVTQPGLPPTSVSPTPTPTPTPSESSSPKPTPTASASVTASPSPSA